ncbi:MAG: SRPBCC family protein [Candidatus Aminicenantes bacterium RBG_16_66_30]
MDRESLTAPPPGSILIIERVFDAPRERVWMAWTDPDLVKRWWGPKGFTSPVCRISLRVGGSYFLCMRSPQGKNYCNSGFYREIVPLERIVVTASFADEKGNIVSATSYGMGPGWAREMLQTMIFEESGGKTKLTLSHAGIPAGEDMKNAREGWSQSLDKLADLLAAEKGARP